MTSEEEVREAFEAWASAPPFEVSIRRIPDDSLAYPGAYRELCVDLAWQAWKQAKVIYDAS